MASVKNLHELSNPQVNKPVRSSKIYASLPNYHKRQAVPQNPNDGRLAEKVASATDSAYGLSHSLSTESLKNACGLYYDDLPSDDDLIEVQSTPECFDSKPSAASSNRWSFKRNKRRNAERNAHGVADFSVDIQQDDAISALIELDAILELHGATQLNSEMETKIEDCLQDLDNYLEKMDDGDDGESDTVSPTKHYASTPTTPRRIRTLPLKSKNKKASKSRGEVPTPGGSLRSSRTLENRPVYTHATPPVSIDITPLKSWRNSVRSTVPLILGDAESDKSLTTATHFADSIETPNNPNVPLASELRRCFSQDDFSTRHASVNPTEMLTQAHIIDNLLEQHRAQHLTDDRPRQFGRRVEGHPSVLTMHSDAGLATQSHCTIINYDQRPTSAPAAVANELVPSDVGNAELRYSLYVGSEASSQRSSQNQSPLSIVSSTDSSCTMASTNGHIEAQLVGHENLQDSNIPLDPENNRTHVQTSLNSEWPHSFSRVLALICCTLGLFNICRFAVLTVHYGGNFLLQFVLLSFVFGIPLLWLQMSLGAKIKSGAVSMWKISPICRGIGIALVMVQCFIAIYSTVGIAWVLVYLRDAFPTRTQPVYPWLEPLFPYRQAYSSNTSSNITECAADYFNVVVLQRLQFSRFANGAGVRFRVSDRLAFNLAIIWAFVFLILCKGLRSYGRVVYGLGLLPLITLGVVTCKFLYVADPMKMENIFSADDFDDFLINSKTWIAAAQEAFLTWGLLGASIISVTSRAYLKGDTKTTLRRDAILVVLVTFLGLTLAALLGVACAQILREYSYVYVPGSFERPDSYVAIYSLKAHNTAPLISFPHKLVPHYSSFIGETYRRPDSMPPAQRDSGYQALRFISELFPVAIALSANGVSWIWTAVAFAMFALFGVAQLCVMWKPISNALGNSISSVLLSCVTGLLLSIPFATEISISILHYMDLLLGGAWFIPVLWTALIFGVFLIRGRPYNGDDLVNDLRMSGSMSAFLALSWNVLLPIGLITLAIIDYKVSLSNQFYYWRGKTYFSFWARKVAGFTQIGLLLLVPITAIVQIYRYLSKGPPDILDRIQLLYRPTEGVTEQRAALRNRRENNNNIRRVSEHINANDNLSTPPAQDDAPPKYTPPPSYTTATGARLAKFLRQSIRRSVRRLVGEAGRSRPVIDTEISQQTLSSDYSTVITHPSGSSDDGNLPQLPASSVASAIRPTNNVYNQRTLSLGRKLFSQKQRAGDINPRSLSASRASDRPFTAEDVVSTLRASTRVNTDRNAVSTRELNVMQTQHGNSFRSIENLILNAEPLDQSPALASCNEQSNTSVI